MVRKIIEINEEKCNGCGICADACHEGAIAIVDGKAKLMRDDYCDGLGDCLPVCEMGAISFVEREAKAYNEEAVKKNQQKKKEENTENYLMQWPVQIKLAPVTAPYYEDRGLLIAADCTAYAYGNFQKEFMKNKVTLIGCPKLDEGDYSEKLEAIIKNNSIKEVIVARMEVPCCGGIENAVKNAIKRSGKFLPWRVITISTDGKVLD